MTKDILEISEEMTINEIEHKDMITLDNLKAGNIGPIITIKAPKGKMIEIVGIDKEDNINAHALRTRITDKDDNAIDFYTEIIITHEKRDNTAQTTKLFYYDICMVKDTTLYEDVNLTKKIVMYRHKSCSEWYRFKNTITLEEGEKLIISAVKPNRDIEKIKLALDARVVTIRKK